MLRYSKHLMQEFTSACTISHLRPESSVAYTFSRSDLCFALLGSTLEEPMAQIGLNTSELWTWSTAGWTDLPSSSPQQDLM